MALFVLAAIFAVFSVNIQTVYSRDYILELKSNAPAIRGSVVKFSADLLEMNGTLANVGDTLKWEWLIDDHEKQEFQTKLPHAEWTYEFPRQSNKNLSKAYQLDVSVGQWYLFFSYPMASASLQINVTTLLNGKMHLSQDDVVKKSLNISTDIPLEQKLEIRSEDIDSIQNASSVVVHWFVDCHYVRQTKEFHTQHIFSEPNKTHHIEALVEASFDPVAAKSVPTLKSRLISNWRSQHKAELPYVCHNKSQVVPDPSKVYGFFETNITVFDSLSDLVVNGTAWINDGDDYHLNIYCSGSPNFEYCIREIDGPYILEGNETCDEWTTMEECQQKLKLPQSVLNVKSFTILVIVRNSVSIERKVFVVNIKQPIMLIAAVAGAVVFTLCIITVVAACIIHCIRKKKSNTPKKPIRSDAESTLLVQSGTKAPETTLITNITRN